MKRIAMIVRSSVYDQPGGDTVQVDETARALRDLGYSVDILPSGEPLHLADYDLLHFFNLGRPADLLRYGRTNIPLVVSPIYVDYRKISRQGMPFLSSFLMRVLGSNGMEYCRTIARGINGSDLWPGWKYVFRGQKNSCAEVLKRAVMVLPTTHREANRLQSAFRSIPEIRVIGLGVSDVFFHPPQAKSREGVICVGRIERRKNQLNAIRAVRDTDIKLTIVGHPARNQSGYYATCREEAGTNVQFVEHIAPGRLAELYAGHKVVLMASYFETFGLSGVEGMAAGCNLVYSGCGDAEEIYADKALRCNPDDPSDIRHKLISALKLPNGKPGEDFAERFSWQQAGNQMAEVYQMILQP